MSYVDEPTFATDMAMGRKCTGCGFRYHRDNDRCAWCGLAIQYSQSSQAGIHHGLTEIALQNRRLDALESCPELDRRRP